VAQSLERTPFCSEMQVRSLHWTHDTNVKRVSQRSTESCEFSPTRDVPDPDTGIRYPVKFRHPALSGINLPDIYRIVL
jgi:hypothetical protein